MSRMALAATSLVAAIPAGLLCFMAAMALFRHAGDMQPLVIATVGGMWVMGLLIALSPIIIAVGKRRAPQAVKAAKSEALPTGTTGAQTAEIVSDVDAAEDLSGEADFSEEVEETEAMDSSEFEQTDDFQFEDDAFLGDELAEAEPEPEPKKKKKKK
ncbi:MAG: hypothetical protein JNG89_04060 [Planctomycetaceae bacterium]|nr:hypothetical protein [Planctomycetaceae bacterium]